MTNGLEFFVTDGICIINLVNGSPHYRTQNSTNTVNREFEKKKKSVRNQSPKILTFHCCILLRQLRKTPNISQDLGELQTPVIVKRCVNISHH